MRKRPELYVHFIGQWIVVTYFVRGRVWQYRIRSY